MQLAQYAELYYVELFILRPLNNLFLEKRLVIGVGET